VLWLGAAERISALVEMVISRVGHGRSCRQFASLMSSIDREPTSSLAGSCADLGSVARPARERHLGPMATHGTQSTTGAGVNS
jgi:hypothetical protein